MTRHFFDLCEELWSDWRGGRHGLPPALASRFQLDACPEPYLDFNAGAAPLLTLTTNPGAAMAHQLRQSIVEGRSPVRLDMAYREAARAMADFYHENLEGAAAKRIAAQMEISEALGTSGLLQVECFPWHSAALPDKAGLLRFLTSDPGLVAYTAAITRFVRSHSAIALSAVGSQETLGTDLPRGPWIALLVSLLRLDFESSIFVPLVHKGPKVTCGAYLSGAKSAPKALVLMMGSNSFPGPDGRATLVRAMQSGE